MTKRFGTNTNSNWSAWVKNYKTGRVSLGFNFMVVTRYIDEINYREFVLRDS